ncbi:MAG: class I SAM-dependent methyltransferase [Candidatus Solibacter sp.]|nr:class I SAM-dependent methyltransferase [Candidatus Solibacter sp.]
MTRLDKLLLHVPRLRRLVLDREAFAAHCARLQHELDESLERERALRQQLDKSGEEARALAAASGDGSSINERMRNDWDNRARTSSRYFIVTGEQARTEESFFDSGEANVRDHILNDLENICQGSDPRRMRIVEIGCGAGRLTRALAAVFGEIHAVDVSGEMIRQARETAGALPNVRLYVNNGADLSVLPAAPFHFAFSFLVFQHVPERSVIETYVREVHRVLEPGALFKFQVEGGPAPDEAPADTWHGVSFSEEELRAMALRCGFEARYLEGAGTQYLWAWFFKP